jgi:glycosyltransferase involved in cell wall biosynthesis
MDILFFVYGTAQIASTRIRVLQYLNYMHPVIKTKVIIADPYIAKKSKKTLIRLGHIVHMQMNLFLFFINSVFYRKIIFLQKVFLPKYMIWVLKKLNRVIVYDFDDAIYLTPENKSRKPKKIRRLNYVLKKASLVVVASEINAEYAGAYNSNVILISGPIECNRFKPSANLKDLNKITIGWIGSSSTTKCLDIIEDAILRLQVKYKEQIEFLFIGTENYKLKEHVRPENWNSDTELNLLSKFDIGIMPLPDDLWSKGKGGYKLLQYMALGIPSVASAVGINSSIVTHGENGYLATSTDEWVYYLEELINSEEKRRIMGEKARQYALSNYSYERYTEILLDKIRAIA